MTHLSFSELSLSEGLHQAVRNMGFEAATPIQSAAIPPLLAGKDVVGQSQTGSGKTAAFAIPAIEKVDLSKAETQVLILCPTRELALQVAEETAKLAKGKPGVRELPVYGGQAYDRQLRGLRQGAHVVIGTPGRVLDHLERGSLRPGSIGTVILDEADRMLDMGFMDEINAILSKMPEDRQMVLFSATVPGPIRKLIQQFTRDPEWIKIETAAMTAPNIEQVWYEVDRRSKLEVLCRLIDFEDIRYAVIFCSTKKMVDELVDHLVARGYAADKLHGDMSQPMREKVMNRFRDRRLEFLVATDVAARGLDVKEIEVVFNYDLPNDGEDYVHRIGRTGRAGSQGKAVTLVAGREVYKLQNLMKHTGAEIKRARVPSVDELLEQRADLAFDQVAEILEKNDFRRHDEHIDRLLDRGYAPTDIISALMDLVEKASGKPEPEEIPEPKAARPKQKGKQGKADKRTPHPGGKSARLDPKAPARKIILNVGRGNKVQAGDVLGAILNEAGIDKSQVGYIKLNNHKTEVILAAEVADKVANKLQGVQIKRRKLKVTVVE
jgi:ATP-dependent RNA helicase DeaD